MVKRMPIKLRIDSAVDLNEFYSDKSGKEEQRSVSAMRWFCYAAGVSYLKMKRLAAFGAM